MCFILMICWSGLQRPAVRRRRKTCRNTAGKYRAVLVDEFQDTIHSVCHPAVDLFASNRKSENAVFYIGDPNRLFTVFAALIFLRICGHRKASIISIRCRRTGGRSFSCNAVNVLFAAPSQPFVYDEIEYNRIEAARMRK